MASLMSIYADEVERELSEIECMEVGSDEIKKAAEVANSLMDRFIKMQQNENDYLKQNLDEAKHELDEKRLEIEAEKLKHEKIAFYVKTGTTIALSVAYAAIQLKMQDKAQLFENNGGMHTTDAGRSSLRNLLNLFGKPTV